MSQIFAHTIVCGPPSSYHDSVVWKDSNTTHGTGKDNQKNSGSSVGNSSNSNINSTTCTSITSSMRQESYVTKFAKFSFLRLSHFGVLSDDNNTTTSTTTSNNNSSKGSDISAASKVSKDEFTGVWQIAGKELCRYTNRYLCTYICCLCIHTVYKYSNIYILYQCF